MRTKDELELYGRALDRNLTSTGLDIFSEDTMDNIDRIKEIKELKYDKILYSKICGLTSTKQER